MSDTMIFLSETRTGVVPSGFFLLEILDRLLKRRNERCRVSQVALSHLEFGDQHTVFLQMKHAITLIYSNAPGLELSPPQSFAIR